MMDSNRVTALQGSKASQQAPALPPQPAGLLEDIPRARPVPSGLQEHNKAPHGRGALLCQGGAGEEKPPKL